MLSKIDTECPAPLMKIPLQDVEIPEERSSSSQDKMSIDGSLENYSRQKTNTLENDPSHLDTITEDPSDDNRSQNKESDVPETSTTIIPVIFYISIAGLIKPNLRMRQLTKMSLVKFAKK
ncbi:15826_t:CDS:2 [Entrophospora sp. SA101]|nr:15826_t:CDS:2 [Entrophospora sp. SA101]